MSPSIVTEAWPGRNPYPARARRQELDEAVLAAFGRAVDR